MLYDTWVISGPRDNGKSTLAAQSFCNIVELCKPEHDTVVIGPKLLRTMQMVGELEKHSAQGFKVDLTRRMLMWKNGHKTHLMSHDNLDYLRGYILQVDMIWTEDLELGLDCYQNLRHGMRWGRQFLINTINEDIDKYENIPKLLHTIPTRKIHD